MVATGTGAATSDSKTVNVTVTAVNDPVTASAPAIGNLHSPRTASVAVTGLSISDADAALAPNGVVFGDAVGDPRRADAGHAPV